MWFVTEETTYEHTWSYGVNNESVRHHCSHLDLLLDVVIEQDVRVDAVVRLRQREGVQGPALCGFLLGLLVPPLLPFQEHSLERRHDTRL